MSNLVEIVVTGRNLAKTALKDAESDSMSLGATVKALGVGSAVALGGMAVAAVKMGSSFNAEITRLNTQADVAKNQLGVLGDGVLTLAGQVGENPNSLAESLFHVESNMASLGISAPAALNMVRIAAEGAKVGGADLVDVTNALTAAVASGIPGVQNISQAMGVLNATVGAGDMKMQDLADAFGTGMVAVVKGYGLSIKDVGAALAVFGDNNIRGAQAGTALRVAVQALAVPAKGGATELAKLGMTSSTLAKDMQSGGLLKALEDLKGHMTAAGVTATQQGDVITTVFGKKAGTGVNILVDQLSRLQSKYPDITKGANQFGDAWATTQKTFSQQVSQMVDGFDALMIRLGEKLIPLIQQLFTFIQAHAGDIKHFADVLAAIVRPVITDFLTGLKAILTELFGPFRDLTLGVLAAAAAWAVINAVLDVNPFILIGTAVILLAGLIVKYHTQIKDTIVDVWDAVRSFTEQVWNDIYNNTVGLLVNLVNTIKNAIFGPFDQWWASHGQEVEDVWNAVWTTVKAIFVAEWDALMAFVRPAWDALVTIVKTAFNVISSEVSIAWAIISGVFKTELLVIETVFNVAWAALKATVSVVFSAIETLIKITWDVIVGIFSVALDLVTGHWSQAWNDVKAVGEQVWNAIRGFLGTVWGAIGSVFGAFTSGLSSVWHGVMNIMSSTASSVWNGIKGFFSGIFDGIKTLFQGFVNGIGGIWNTLTTIFKAPISFLVNTVYDNGIARIWNDTMGKLGLPTMPVEKFAGGGRLDGFGGGDSVLAMLEPGEAVVDKDRTRRFAPVLRAMGVPGFAGGGVVGDVGNLLMDAATLDESGFISDFLKMLPGGTGGAKGAWGQAITRYPEAMVSTAVHGVWGRMGGLLGKIGDILGNVFWGGGSGPFKGLIGQSVEKVYKQTVDNVMTMLGLPTGLDSIVLAQLVTESGGNQIAVNKSDINWQHGTPSVGLMQVIGPTFDAYAGIFRNVGPFLYGVSTNPFANIYAGLNYAIHRYGPGWVNVLGHGHGYAAGGVTSAGWATLNEHGPELVKLPGGATVIPAGAAARMMAGGGDGIGMLQLEVTGNAQDDLTRFLVTLLKRYIRITGGGNVQAALGRY